MAKSIKEQLAESDTRLARNADKNLQEIPAVQGTAARYDDGDFLKIEVDSIRENPYQPRKHFDPEKMAELTLSVQRTGVIQPIAVRFGEDGHFYLVAGERRLRASKDAGLKTIPAVITKGEPAEIALIENIQREDLNPIEEAEAMERMIREYSHTHENLAHIVGKSRATVTEILSLNKLPESVKEECRRVDIYPKRMLFEIVRQKTPEKMTALFEKIKAGNLKSDQVKELTGKKRSLFPRQISAGWLSSKIAGLISHIGKINAADMEQSEREQLFQDMEKLRAAIDAMIDAFQKS